MNNYQWLLQMDGAERKAWFDAEHVETANAALDGDADAQDGDSRELILTDLEKKTREWHDYDGNYMRIYSDVAYAQMKELLDRQAAITERDATKRHELFCETCEATTDKQIAELTAELEKATNNLNSANEDFENARAELTAERDNLKANNEQLHTLAGEQAAKIDELQSALDAICANLSINANGEPNVIADIAIETIEALIDECNTANRHCNEYRNKFGKCLDYADAIHALMDEGIA